MGGSFDKGLVGAEEEKASGLGRKVELGSIGAGVRSGLGDGGRSELRGGKGFAAVGFGAAAGRRLEV